MKIKFNFKFWLYYSLILTAIMFVGGLFISRGIKNLVVANFLLLPLVLCFWFLKKIQNYGQDPLSKFQKVLLFYSLTISSLITIGGFYITRSTAELISNIIFLPVTLFCWYAIYKRPKIGKGLAGKTTDLILKKMAEAAKKRGLDETQN